MRRRLFLALTLFLSCLTTAMAAFNPTAGTMYALKVNGTSLYLDIQTLGIHEPNYTTNSVSLSTTPSVIYFEAGSNGGWTMKNINGTYAMQPSSRAWNAVIGSTAYEWTIAETEEGSAIYTIARSDGKLLGSDNVKANEPLYCNRPNNGLRFVLVEYTSIADGLFTLESPSGTYISLTTSSTTAASFQESPTSFYVKPSGKTYFFETEDGKHIGLNGNWNVSATDNAFWSFSECDGDGFLHITRSTDATYYLGSNQNTNVGTGIFTNVNSSCNKWLVEGYYDYTTTATASGSKMHFTSDKIFYPGGCNTLRFTLTESGAYYKNGAKRLSLDYFVLYDSEGNVVELAEGDFSGNNGKGYANMLDGNNGTCSNAAWDSSAAEDDYFEIALDTDLGGSFSFAFVSENTTMNPKKFRIDISFVETNYTFNIVAPEGVTPTATYNGTAIESGATLPSSFDTALLVPQDIEGYEWSIVVDKSAKTVTLTYTRKYMLTVEAPEGNSVSVTYNGVAVAADSYIDSDFDTWLFDATDIEGYTWEVVVDRENRYVSIVYTELSVTENPAAVVNLVNRIGGTTAADKFKFVLDPTYNLEKEAFLIGSDGGKILIKGTTVSAITTGLGWYLNNYANINIAWNSLNEKKSGEAYADLSSLPVPSAVEERTCDAEYRYYLNYCTFGYSMTSWTWKRWQQEIDWMALHGVNMPLQIVGLEEVWRKFLTMTDAGGSSKYNYSAEEAKAFVAGPAFTAWWGMNNLEGWGGTASDGWGGVQDDAWYARQQSLATQILDRQRELGMQPVLPGFSGMVPTNFTDKTGVATDVNGGSWCGFARPRIIDPTDSRFADIAADYYTCLKEVMGESKYYSMDPFHEGGSISSGRYTEAYKAIYDAMYNTNANSQWVIQQWQWNSSQKLSLTAVPERRLIVLDLFSDGKPAFDSYSGYAPQDAIYCAIPNFGGRSGLMGRLNNLTDNYFTYKGKYATIKGIGAAPEAIEQTPITYDLLFQLPWMGEKPDVAEWVSQYANSRYGKKNTEVEAAWELLRMSALNYGADGIQGPIEDVWAARPNLTAAPASAWGKTISAASDVYTKERRRMLIEATYKLLSQSSSLALAEGSIYESNYNYDIVEFGGAVLADYAYDLLLGIASAKSVAGSNFESDATYIARRDAFLALIAEVDEFKGTNLNFRLGKWTQEARDAAAEVNGAVSATADWYEFNNARTIITVWGDLSQNNQLRDYSYRSWQGLLKDYYLPRWEYFFENGCTAPNSYFYFEWNWAHGMEHYVGQTSKSTTKLASGAAGYSYSPDAEGNTVEIANELLGKYLIPITVSGKETYAYRYIDNDYSNLVTVIAEQGKTLDLTNYFGELGDVTVSGEFMDAASTDLSNVTVSSSADGAYTGKIVLADCTSIEFAVVVNPAYYGVYHINYNGKPVFIGYNTDTDNAGNVGYKLLNPNGNYSSQATEGDKYAVIAPMGTGYSISMQGMYMKNPNYGAWNHILFSQNSGDAGTYLFEETTTDGLFKLYSPSTASDPINYVNDYGNLFGNDKSSKGSLSTFTLTEVTSYPFTVPACGMTTLCLPFNVILPAGVTAYDVTALSENDENSMLYTMTELAVEGETVKAGTPFLAVAAAGSYTLAITMSDDGAKSQSATSLLRGNYVSTTIASGEEVKKYTLQGSGKVFAVVESETAVAANSCWIESDSETTYLFSMAMPFTITIDEDNPVMYQIISRRAKQPEYGAVTYTGGTTLGIAEQATNRLSQLWYFVLVDGSIKIKPVTLENNIVVGATSLASSATINTITEGTDEYITDWCIEAGSEAEYYHFYIPDGGNKYYLFGGTGTARRYYVGMNTNAGDWGIMYKFQKCDANKGYLMLSEYNSTLPATILFSDNIGTYADDDFAAVYKECYSSAAEMLASNSATSVEMLNLCNSLKEAYEALTMNMPEAGKFYTIRSHYKENHYTYVNEYNQLYYANEANRKMDSRSVWQFEGTENGALKLKALHTSSYTPAVTSNNSSVTLAAEGGNVTFIPSVSQVGTTQVKLDGVCLHYNNGNGNCLLKCWEAGDAVTGNLVYIEEVQASDISYSVNIDEDKWNTLYLSYPVTIPENISAYTAYEANGDIIKLAEVSDVIPANTAVFVYSETAADYEFVYSADAAVAVAEDKNLLEGRLWTSAVKCLDGYNYYMMLVGSTGAKMYWIYEEYSADGTIHDGNAQTDYGGYILCNANRAYMPLEEKTAGETISYRFDFSGTTGIDDGVTENRGEDVIFDLNGRRIKEVTAPGIYIVNGKKCYVRNIVK